MTCARPAIYFSRLKTLFVKLYQSCIKIYRGTCDSHDLPHMEHSVPR